MDERIHYLECKIEELRTENLSLQNQLSSL